jgi:hypothetical protein
MAIGDNFGQMGNTLIAHSPSPAATLQAGLSDVMAMQQQANQQKMEMQYRMMQMQQAQKQQQFQNAQLQYQQQQEQQEKAFDMRVKVDGAFGKAKSPADAYATAALFKGTVPDGILQAQISGAIANMKAEGWQIPEGPTQPGQFFAESPVPPVQNYPEPTGVYSGRPGEPLTFTPFQTEKYRKTITDPSGNLFEVVENPDGSTALKPVSGTTPNQFAKPPKQEPAAVQKANAAFQGALTEVDNAMKSSPIKVSHWYGGSTVYDDTGLELAIDRAFSANKDMANTIKQELVRAQDTKIRKSVLTNIQKAITAEQGDQSGTVNYGNWK